jgi:O-methyltransferase
MRGFVRSCKEVVKLIFQRAGIQLDGTIVPHPGKVYEIITPRARYSPWNRDKEFLSAFSQIRPYTLVDLYRCYELWSLVRRTALLNSGALLEVGVWRGGTGALLAKSARLAGLRAPVYLCDTFSGVVKAGEHDTYYKGGEHSDATEGDVRNLMSSLALDNVRILKGIFPEDTGSSIANETFGFCHIDVDVYQSAHDILNWVWPRLVTGGMVVYDDYGFDSCSGVTKHVDEQAALGDRVVIYNLNGHAIIVKLR